jgi:hypothetical protein
LNDGISGSDAGEDFSENPTEAEAARFQNEFSELEILELHKLEDAGLCDG